ncbi:MAG: PAS domain-containing protein [Telluria sp.]
MILSRDDWAMVTLDFADGAAPQRHCSSADAAVRAAFGMLESRVAAPDCDLPELNAAQLPARGSLVAERAGMLSYRSVRRRLALSGGRQGSCVLATARARVREPDPEVVRGLGLLAEQIGERVEAWLDVADAGLAREGEARMRSAAEQAREQFRLLFESAPGLFLVLTPDHFRIVAASNAYLAATMVTREQIMGRTVFEVFPDNPDDEAAAGVAELRASLERVRQTGLLDVMAVQRHPIRRPPGEDGGFELRYWSPINSPALDPDGSIVFIIHRVEDVTGYVLAHQPPAVDGPLGETAHLEAEIVLRSLELKRLADSLAQSEQRFRYVTQATNDVVWDWSVADDVLWCSRSAQEPIGSALARCVRSSDWEAWIHPEDRQRVVDSLRASVTGREAHWAAEYRLSLGDGDRCVLHRCSLVIDALGQPQRMVGSISDLTEQKSQGARLRMQAEMLDYATDAILVRDLDNRVLYWNQAAAQRYGWSSAEVIGRPVAETLYAHCPPADFRHAMQILMRHGDFAGRMLHSTADGRIIVVHVHWILVRHEDGTPRAILSVVTDLSERIALEQRLLQTQKLESLGRLTGGIAHDFNNWLTVIIGNAEELVEALAGRPELGEAARMIQMAGERGAQLTRRLLAFARRQPLTPQVLAPGEIIDALSPLVRRALPENVDLRLPGTGHGWCVYADRGQLEAAVLNLCINARDAMPGGGKLTIEILLAEVDAEAAEFSKELAPGEYVVIAISDNGHGIARDMIDHVFEPFFTTKDEASGSGLGLSMVYGFVRQSNGDVTIYSEHGRGALVKLYLPRVYLEPQQPAVPERARATVSGGCSILLVEDDAIVREHILAQLRDLGCDVLTASNAGEALALLEQGRNVDVLFSDVVMPGMSGIELARRARALHPDLRILLSSGYTFEAMQHQGQLDPGFRLLNKPYGKNLLAQTLADVLDDAGRTK